MTDTSTPYGVIGGGRREPRWRGGATFVGGPANERRQIASFLGMPMRRCVRMR
jgi:hypothetical protein